MAASIGSEKFKRMYSSDSIPTKDEFQRRGFAQRIVTTILKQPLGECLVISIVGPWGSGKSTVLRYVTEEIAARTAREGTCQIAPFNPWRFSGEESLLFELFDSLVKAIDPDGSILKPWQKFKKQAVKFSNLAATGAAAIAEATVPGASQTVSTLIQNLLPANLNTTIDEIRVQAAEYLRDKQKRVVVLLDDIDRLDGSDMLLLFRAIKLSADLPNTIFIMAMDEEHVSEVIGDKIGRTAGAGLKYIEKIVNVRIGLPAIPSHILTDYTLDLINEVTPFEEKDADRSRRVFLQLISPFIKTPRTAKSIQNAFAFAIGLLPGEVNVGDVMLLEATRLIHPSIFSELQNIIPNISRQSPFDRHDSDKEAKNYEDEVWNVLLKDFNDGRVREREEIKKALKLWFPQLHDMAQRDDNDGWIENKRICSQRYFWRYFSGAIQVDDVRDEVVQNWAKTATFHNSDCAIKLKEHLQAPYGRAFLTKLESIGSQEAYDTVNIIIYLSRVGSALEAPKKEGLKGSVRKRSAILAGILVSHIKAAYRDRAVIECISQSSDLSWSFDMWQYIPDECINAFTKDKEGGGEHVSAVDQHLADLSLHKYESGIFPKSDSLIGSLIGSISRNIKRPGMKRRLAKLVKSSPQFAFHLLASGCWLGTSQSTRACWRWDEPKSSERVDSLIDQKILTAAIKKRVKAASKTSRPLKLDNSRHYYTLEQLGDVYLHYRKLRATA